MYLSERYPLTSRMAWLSSTPSCAAPSRAVDCGADAASGVDSDSDSEVGRVVCEHCNCGGHEDCMLLCDGCNTGYHMYCLSPPLERVLDSPDAHNALLAAYASSGQVERALRAVMAMQRAGPPPDVATYGAVVAACLKTNQWDRALGVVEALVSGTGVTPNEAIFNSLLKAAAEAGDKATARIDDVRELMLRWQEQSARRRGHAGCATSRSNKVGTSWPRLHGPDNELLFVVGA